MDKKKIFLATLLLPLLAIAENAELFNISDLNINKSEKQLTLNMTVNPKGFRLKSNETLSLRPLIISETSDTIALPPVRIAGKGAWIAEIREGISTPFTLARAGKGEPILYSTTVDMNEVFNKSQVIIMADTANVCNCHPPKRGLSPIIDIDFCPIVPTLAFRYVTPSDVTEKVFDLSGRANIIFKVNRTEIDWTYADNYAELDTILHTINAVRDNPDATVESITLTGYASPEGSYANNVRLAKGRTEAVKDYVMQNSSFPASVYHTSYVPEDWEGLRAWLETSAIPKREAMIAFIDDNSIPLEKRNDIFRVRFPEEYPFLLKNVYPSLRHTDYKITYRIRQYYDVNEIRQVMRTNPRNLSLNELFLLANSYKPGSEEYDEVFSLAARLYPDNLTANLNAANSAINRGQYAEAARYLDRAGDGPDANYARGVLALYTGDIDAAEKWFILAKKEGLSEAQAGLDEIARFRNFQGEIRIL